MKMLGYWWVGSKEICGRCGMRFELEDDDQPYRPREEGYPCQVDCPACSAAVAVRKPYNVSIPFGKSKEATYG